MTVAVVSGTVGCYRGSSFRRRALFAVTTLNRPSFIDDRGWQRALVV